MHDKSSNMETVWCSGYKLGPWGRPCVQVLATSVTNCVTLGALLSASVSSSVESKDYSSSYLLGLLKVEQVSVGPDMQ